MERSSFIRTLAGSGLSVFGIGALSSFRDSTSLPDINRLPDHINANAPDFTKVRDDFPRIRNEVYMDNASTHPINIYTAAALHRYTEWAKNNVGDPWWPDWTDTREACKKQFAQ